jgi:cell division protease FtsH
MAKENNPNPNKFKVSPWLVYSYFTYFLIYQFVTGSSSLQSQHQLTHLNSMDFRERTKKVIVYNKTEAEVF